jgi:ABC-2 type transport system permease protein
MTTTVGISAQPSTSPVPAAEHRPATRSTGDAATAVVAALKSDWIKVSTVRANRALLALTIVGGLLVSWAVAVLVTDQVQHVAQVGFFWTSVTSMLAAIGGVLIFGSDVQHGTLATAAAARPARWVLALSKTLTAAALGFVIGAAGLAAGFGGAIIGGLHAGDTAALAASVGWALLFTTLSAVFGLGVSMIVRNSTAAIGGLLVWGYVVENLFKLFLADEVARFLPFIAGNHLLAYTSDLESPHALAIALTRPENALVFGSYTAISLVVGTVLLYRRDTN